ncbi:MAG: PqqD family protein [Planctomycetota bacterium]
MKPNAVNITQLLAAVPTRNAAVREEQRGEALVLFVPIRRRWWLRGPLSWCLPLRGEKGVALDALGQEVWRACDGQRDLEALVEAFAQRHRLGFHEARLTVMRFLRMLAQRNLLVLVGTSAAAAATEEDGGVVPKAVVA